MVQKETQAERIIKRFGGIHAMARILGHKHASTVGGWKAKGQIPQWHHVKIMKAAKKNNIPLQPTEFLVFDLEVAE